MESVPSWARIAKKKGLEQVEKKAEKQVPKHFFTHLLDSRFGELAILFRM